MLKIPNRRGRIFLIVLCCFLPLLVEGRVVRVGVFPAAPLVFLQGQRPDGLFIDLIKHFAQVHDWQLEYVEKTWSELLQDLEKGQIDLLPAVGNTSVRQEKFDFGRHTVFIDSGVLFVSTNKAIRTIFDLEGKKVAAVRGSLFTNAFLEYSKSFGVQCEMLFTQDNQQVMQAIVNGEVSAGVSIYSLGAALMREFPVHLTGISFSPIALGFAVPKGKNNDLLQAIDQTMGAMLDDPKSVYSQSFKKWMGPSEMRLIPSWLWGTIFGVIALAGILAAWNFFLKREVRQKTKILQEEKERLAVTLSSIADGVIATDGDGKITLMNQVAEKLTSWNFADASGMPFDKVYRTIDASTRRLCDGPISRVSSPREQTPAPYQTLLLAKDGREIMISDSAAAIRDKNNNSMGAVVVFRDVTEKNRFLESAQRSERLEAIGILAGGIAHDFNNLLAGLYGHLELARLKAPEKSETALYLEKAQKSSSRAKNLTQQLLPFAKGGGPHRQVGTLRHILKDSAQFALSGSNVLCDFNIAEDLWNCTFDENQIWQVLENLYINALQAMPQGGKITVTARNLPSEMKGGVDLKGDHYVQVTIRDTGPGIAPNILAHIFEPFFTTKKKGSGLGLATAYSIIKKHEGTLTVESPPGQGATFSIYFPVTEQKIADRHAPEKVTMKGSARILIMDDELDVREIVGAMLENLGHKVHLAKNGEETLHQIHAMAQGGTPIEAVIMDLTIPDGMGGRQTIKLLREIDKKIVVIVSSGYSDDPVMANPHEYGFTDKLPKPFSMNELSELLARYLTAQHHS
ncbi:MAG: hypothetical protein A2X86_14745 [Bdellovibrionales bacterium GWA2_49_15]|nr:MAG: hypothetical protein A2X86_14745 [Bdellovibrionales bacterium GWA2_49_15]HAZ13401.1 hypothetical protein [Bdellovibrionales bacterium]